MKNSKNQNATSILTSNNSGVGKTDHLPSTYSFIDNTLSVTGYNDVTLSDAILKALFINNLHREFKNKSDLQPVLDAYSNDFLGTFHANSKADTVSNPVGRIGKVVSSENYLLNCMNSKVTSKDTAIQLKELLDKSSSSSTKAELLGVISNIHELFVSKEDMKSFTTIVANEKKDAVAFQSLTNNGFLDIVRMDNGNFTATINPDSMGTMNATLVENAYALESTSFNADKGMLEVVFSEVVE